MGKFVLYVCVCVCACYRMVLLKSQNYAQNSLAFIHKYLKKNKYLYLIKIIKILNKNGDYRVPDSN